MNDTMDTSLAQQLGIKTVLLAAGQDFPARTAREWPDRASLMPRLVARMVKIEIQEMFNSALRSIWNKGRGEAHSKKGKRLSKEKNALVASLVYPYTNVS